MTDAKPSRQQLRQLAREQAKTFLKNIPDRKTRRRVGADLVNRNWKMLREKVVVA